MKKNRKLKMRSQKIVIKMKKKYQNQYLQMPKM